ncbi:UDP-N-acetyl-D-mannosamine dehydrogenase [Arthrobacter caoxuetaonis]|uniref:UDP-N-acetyl-D-mannosamine dehydrogenase n=1 Tax=Arthrobacter caoxuetaonis TaxID=2886935 RepID=A0A9X1SCE4_9MICC|nr:UDP-N-acetyl-D-mannosamine dehydrogenase [Arthrobacter caoxuetaonis]MCC3297611.1 UDP-N-acetyl-D-mannosamine dehydrogenase [Arthrobacter caoxuetaonis]USQ56181.1 UDP-N-acetyl-D-mannosamine dehydrogenase [Arthrobacter caoxuetaonis]
MKTISTVAVIGLGYIGLPTATILATNGLRVIGVDVNTSTIDAVNRGEVPFVEPDLAEFLEQAVTSGRLSATAEMPAADAFIVAVPTPFNADKSADLSFIEAAATSIAPMLQGGELLILESTSPPGATKRMGEVVAALRPDLSFGEDDSSILLAHCPERVLPGRIMVEIVTNDRIIGGTTRTAAERAKDLYSSFCKGDIHLTDATTAEMAKLVENSYRDVNIAFANELSMISDKLDINVWELIRLANYHPRVNILQPGPGVGGHCIAVDPWFIVAAAPDEANIIRTARTVNDSKPEFVVEQVLKAVKSTGATSVAALGLAFKANVDDLRESPAVGIVKTLSQRLVDVSINVVEPHVVELPKPLSGTGVSLVSLEEAIATSKVILLLVDHDAFAKLGEMDLSKVEVIDTKGMLEASKA